MGFTVKLDDIEKRMAEVLEQAVPKDAARGLFAAGSQLLIDAMEVRPNAAPFKEGHLWGSAGVAGKGAFRKLKNANADSIKQTRHSISGEFGFNSKHAARWHELEVEEEKKITWSTPGSGRKFLEKKLVMFKVKYMEIVADYIRKRLKK